MNTINFKGQTLTGDEFLKKIFAVVPEKIPTTLAELKTLATKENFGEKFFKAFTALATADDFKKFIMNPFTKNAEVKDLLVAFFDGKNLAYNNVALKNCNKNHVAFLVDLLFDFGETSGGGDEKRDAETRIHADLAELSIDKMQKILSRCKPTVRDDVDVTQFELTEKMPVTLQNDFYLIVPRSLIYYGAVALVAQNNLREVAAVGHLRFHEGKTHILLSEKNIDYKLFREQNTFSVVLFPQEAAEVFQHGELWDGEVFTVDCIIDLKRLEPARSTLCIDFGTSNTTVGTYGVKNPDALEPEVVEFIDETGETPVTRQVLPTIVYVQSVDGKPKYLFGYDALKKVIDMDYNPTASVFYEIKRQITNIDAVETVTDEQGRKAEISHREIIFAYLSHVLELAERYFRRRFTNLHFTAPVKLKDSFIAEMQKMFNTAERTVCDAAHSIDEGIAIIYNHIAEQAKAAPLKHVGASEKVLIMDCGGGTTDLACCEYSVVATDYNKNLNIVTKFENGDSNFGGNNVTFRILQLLKIKLAHKLQGDDCSVQQLIDDENKLLREIDSNHEHKPPLRDDREIAYGRFVEEYERAETFVPTKFGDEKLLQRKNKLKRNFYYLWQMAEAYKIQFYRANMDLVSVNFNNPADRKIGIPDDDKYYLYVKNSADGQLEKLTNPMSGLEITNNDIHRLLYADIYSLLKNVLSAYDDNEQELLKYNYYKLSGQSCKITLFTELLKEFIPGKYLRYGDEKAVSPDSLELKLACIKGSIYYMRDTEFGEIKPKITMETPKLIYDVYKIDVDGKIRTPLLESGSKDFLPAVEKISSEARRVKLVIEARNGRRQNTIDFEIEHGVGRGVNTTELAIDIAHKTNDADGKIGKHAVKELTDINLSRERDGTVFALFVVPSKTGYGFYLYCLSVESGLERYHLTCAPKYFSFENEDTETFFDGGR